MGDIGICGQESNATTCRLAIMNLAICVTDADIGKDHADTFRRDLNPDLRANTVTPGSAKPKPRSHPAGLMRSERQLLANGSMSSNQSGEGSFESVFGMKRNSLSQRATA